MDVSQDALHITKGKVSSPLLCASAEKLPYGAEVFSCVVAMDVIEHLQHPEGFLSEAHRVVKKNGVFIFTTPNPSSLGARLKGNAPRRTDLPPWERLNEWQGWRDDTHISIKSTEEWRSLLDKYGFKIVRDGTSTLWDVPYTRWVPYGLQKIVFISAQWVLTWLFGFFPWRYGENYVCISRKI